MKVFYAGLIILALGLVFLVVSIMGAAGSVSEAGNVTAFLAPGEATVTVDEPGTQWVWNEYEINFEGKQYTAPRELPDDFTINITDASGEAVTIGGGANMSSSGTINGRTHARESIGTVDFPAAGDYTVTVTGDFEPRVVSVGAASAVGGLLGGIFGALCSGVLAFIGLIVTIIGLIVRKKKAA